ncbi:MAG: hypothetical protein CL831_10765 [Crocinitomicaceae bacterium]|nr:hypothetical protein [Crocinitomicaceae bacterium]
MRESIFQYWPHCTIFDVAAWNCFTAVDHNSSETVLLSPAERLHVLVQSERMGFMADLTIHERLLLIEQQEQNSVFLLDNTNVDHVAFGGIPHSVADYVLLLIAKKKGIGVSMHQDLPMIKGGHFIYDSDFSIHTRRNEDKTIKMVKDYKPKAQRQDKWADTYRFVSSQKLGSQIGIYQYLQSEENQNGDALSYYHKWQSNAINLGEVKDIKNSIFIFLHNEPEATVNPVLGASLPRQIDFIRLIRRSVQDSIPIYIKEHPAMFLAAWEDKQVNYNAYRGTNILTDIIRLHNCELLDAETKTDELLEHQPICASIMGTIQSEALIKGCPLISSKAGPLKGAEGVLIVDNSTAYSTLDSAIFNKSRIDLESALTSNQDYVSDMLSQKAFKGSPNAGMSMYHEFSEEELQRNNSSTAKSIIYISNLWKNAPVVS